MSQDFGPFSVVPAQVVGLGGALFQNLVNRLLAAEIASAGMAGSDLHTFYQDNIGDQGVDAGVYAAARGFCMPARAAPRCGAPWRASRGVGPEVAADNAVRPPLFDVSESPDREGDQP